MLPIFPFLQGDKFAKKSYNGIVKDFGNLEKKYGEYMASSHGSDMETKVEF